jgi:hypothetical protein
MILLSNDCNPVLFRRLRHELVPATITRNEYGHLSATPHDGDRGIYVARGENADAFVGISGYIRLNGSLEFVTETDLKEEAAVRESHERERQRHADEIERKAQERREQARLFNFALPIPVKWLPGHRIVLSGLSANSWGDGSRRNTVYHVVLQEPLHVGRLKRSTGDLLCSTNRGRFDLGGPAQKTSLTEELPDYNEAYQYRVTCKTCLAIAERLHP